MYNARMPENSFEIRICNSCGLRYPLTADPAFGTRCPACMGETRIALRRELSIEPRQSLPTDSFRPKIELAVLLDNIRSAWNAGSILRSADGFGFSQAYFCGITPTPDHDAVKKTSLGAEDSVPWSYHKDAVRLVQGLSKMGRRIYVLEEHERAMPIDGIPGLDRDAVLIVGNEITGVDPGLLKLCDEMIQIPMRGEKKSFNVAIAFSIAAYALGAK